MSSSTFEVKEHKLECQHIREFARATAYSQEEVLYLSIKQYIPLGNPDPEPGDITIIGAHANGFPKEMYEPLWDDILFRSKTNGFRIRSIWIADLVSEGGSGILNENVLGNDPAWSDHARDLLHMVNHFRSEMPMPIVGIGHSLGGNILANLALMHPRLLSTLVLLDPVIQIPSSTPFGAGPSAPQMSAFRRDLWPSRQEAEATFRKSKFYQAWDPRVLDRWCQFGIRETPTALYPEEKGTATLATTKHQECFNFLRSSWEAFSEDGKTIINRELVPDLDPSNPTGFPFYRSEPASTLARLGELRPSVLYIFGELSDMSFPEARRLKMEVTGSKHGGSGGVQAGRVKEKLLKGIGHLVAMEATDQCADATASWLGHELKRFELERKSYEEWTKKSMVEKTTLSEEWKRRIGGPLKPPKGKL